MNQLSPRMKVSNSSPNHRASVKMSHPSQSNAKQRSTLMAVGGFVIGASAMAVVLGLNHLRLAQEEQPASLRGSDQSPGSIDSTRIQGDQTMVSYSAQVLGYPITAPTVAPSASAPTYNPSMLNPTVFPTYNLTSDSPTEQDEEFSALFAMPHDSMTLTVAPSTPAPTYTPSVLIPTVFPTYNLASESPTEQDEEFSALFAMPRSSMTRSNQVGFRLKLYWEDGYYWQERTEEKWWCMSCRDGCEKDHRIELRNCKSKNDLDATFVAISHGNAGYQLQVANTNLCLQMMSNQRAIKLKCCKSKGSRNMSVQLFANFSQNEKFDLRPVRNTTKCLSNHHHPKGSETIYAEKCRKAHRTTTGYWVAY